MSSSQFSRRQKFTFLVIAFADLSSGITLSLQAPFYPREAESKGCTASEYGFVFGIFQLIMFLVSPYFGGKVHKFGAKLMFNTAIFSLSLCSISFGLLDIISSHYPFFISSVIVRTLEAISEAAFMTSSFTIIANEFPENTATTFSSIETFYGIGIIIGPTIGGILYDLGGYRAPFMILGSLLFVCGLVTLIILPTTVPNEEEKKNASVFTILKIPQVLISSICSAIVSFSIGFTQATLEPHLRQFNLTPVLIGMVMVISGATYAITAPIIGWMCDKKIKSIFITLLGTFALTIGFIFIGPLPFLIPNTSLFITCVGLFLQGLGISCQAVTAFIDSLNACCENGFPNNIQTKGLVSGLWTSSFSLGAFIGPITSGIFYDLYGFRKSTLIVVILGLISFLMVLVFILIRRPKVNVLSEETINLLENENLNPEDNPRTILENTCESEKKFKFVSRNVSSDDDDTLSEVNLSPNRKETVSYGTFIDNINSK